MADKQPQPEKPAEGPHPMDVIAAVAKAPQETGAPAAEPSPFRLLADLAERLSPGGELPLRIVVEGESLSATITVGSVADPVDATKDRRKYKARERLCAKAIMATLGEKGDWMTAQQVCGAVARRGGQWTDRNVRRELDLLVEMKVLAKSTDYPARFRIPPGGADSDPHEPDETPAADADRERFAKVQAMRRRHFTGDDR